MLQLFVVRYVVGNVYPNDDCFLQRAVARGFNQMGQEADKDGRSHWAKGPAGNLPCVSGPSFVGFKTRPPCLFRSLTHAYLSQSYSSRRVVVQSEAQRSTSQTVLRVASQSPVRRHRRGKSAVTMRTVLLPFS